MSVQRYQIVVDQIAENNGTVRIDDWCKYYLVKPVEQRVADLEKAIWKIDANIMTNTELVEAIQAAVALAGTRG